MPPVSHFSKEILKLGLPFYIDIFVCRKVLDDQTDCLYPGLYAEQFNDRNLLYLPQTFTYIFLPQKMSFLPYKKSQSWLPGVSLPSELCWRGKKKNQMSFCTLESNCRSYNSFFSPLCNLYINYIRVAFSEIHPLQICFVFGRPHLQLWSCSL